MKLGFVSAILPDLSLEEVVAFAAETGYGCVELMAKPSVVTPASLTSTSSASPLRTRPG